MSVLSDDTDVLLLIPPDFFLVPSDSEEESVTLKKPSERLLFSDLISQVNDLEGRLCQIENQHFYKMPLHGNLQHMRHYGSADTLNTSYKSSYNSRSLHTTPMKTQTLPSPWKLGLSPYKSKLEQHQNLLKSSEYVNQKEKDDLLLKEIHNFFKNKNNRTDKENDVNGKGSDEDKSVSGVTEIDTVHLSTAVFNLNKVNDLLQQLEETQSEIEQKLKLKGFNDSEENLIPEITNKKVPISKPDVSTNEHSVKTTPRRFLNFDQLSPKKTEKAPSDQVKSDLADNLNLDSDPTSPKVKGDVGDINSDRKVESQSSASELTNLLSLCNLWGSNNRVDDGKVIEDQKVLRQKYQEEKCRRQHCEDLIQKLQLRLLEEQQKIAVAIKVDQEKDEAIAKLTDGWNKLVESWKEVETQRNNLAKKLHTERDKFQNEISVACQTVKRYETELSKALDLAHGYKEKCELTDKEKKQLMINASKEVDSLRAELKDVKAKLEKEQIQIEKLEKLVAAKEETLNQVKSKFFETQNHVRDLKKSLKDQQTEMEILKHEKEKLSEKLKDEKNKVSILEQNKKVLMQNNEELKKKEKSLKDNIKSMTEQMDKVKVELKDFYQEQVEKIVQEKLKEFQEQLTKAEKMLQNEIEEREKKVTELAVKQVQQIVEKHVVEVNLMEEKHKEETALWKIRVAQAEEKVQGLQKKLELYSSQKTEIAQKLQSVMETQLQEALKIITATSPQHQKSPLDSGRSETDKSLTRQNTFTMASVGWEEGNLNKSGYPGETESPSVSTPTETPFCKDGQLTYRKHLNSEARASYRIDETPQKIDSEAKDPLKKYIQMLLERPPGLPIDDSVDKSFDSTLFNSVTNGFNFLQWQHILSERSSQANSEAGKQKEKETKVSWK